MNKSVDANIDVALVFSNVRCGSAYLVRSRACGAELALYVCFVNLLALTVILVLLVKCW